MRRRADRGSQRGAARALRQACRLALVVELDESVAGQTVEQVAQPRQVAFAKACLHLLAELQEADALRAGQRFHDLAAIETRRAVVAHRGRSGGGRLLARSGTRAFDKRIPDVGGLLSDKAYLLRGA